MVDLLEHPRGLLLGGQVRTQRLPREFFKFLQAGQFAGILQAKVDQEFL